MYSIDTLQIPQDATVSVFISYIRVLIIVEPMY